MKASDCCQHISKNSHFDIDLSPGELKLKGRGAIRADFGPMSEINSVVIKI